MCVKRESGRLFHGPIVNRVRDAFLARATVLDRDIAGDPL